MNTTLSIINFIKIKNADVFKESKEKKAFVATAYWQKNKFKDAQ